MRALRALRAWWLDWPAQWRSRTPRARWLPATAIVTWWLALGALGGLRSDHLTLGAAILLLSYAGRLAWRILMFILPVFLTGVVYDSQHLWGHLVVRTIHVREPYDFDLRFFGIAGPDGRRLTPNEWWQLHTRWWLDLVTGFYYLTFIFIFVSLMAWFHFRLSSTGTARRAAAWIRERSLRPMWAFFLCNVLGYSTYYWYGAAPPWYVTLHGLGPADMSARPSAAGCLRFDELLGTHFFTEMYGRSADVFGAIPSLHVAYPLIACWYAVRFGAGRAFALSFYAIMCFSAVYLNHHYILDILWGSAYALLICAAVDAWGDHCR
jgi:hypothetical protein